MVMISELATKDSGIKNNLSPRYIKAKEEVSVEISIISTNMIKGIIKIGIDQIAEIEEFNLVVEINVDRGIEVDQDMDKAIGNFRGNVKTYQNQNYSRQNNRDRHGGDYRNDYYNRERGRSRSRELSYSDDSIRRDRSNSHSRSRSGSRACTNGDRIRCYKCKECNHFTKDCLTTKE